MTKNHKIVKRIVFGINVKLASPLCVSSGEDEFTDSDLQRNFNGQLFVPGTSLAGAMRAYVDNGWNLFGISEKNETAMSPLTVSDLYFSGNPEISDRDGVKLENKVAEQGGKFNLEIMEAGAEGRFHLCLTIREGNLEEKWVTLLKCIFNGIHSGEIRFGGKKNRGFGHMEISQLYQKEYTRENAKEWIDYGHNGNTIFADKNAVDLKDWMNGCCSPYLKLKIPLHLTGGISIRKYALEGDADFEHIRCGGIPVVPGTSWAGAVRDRMSVMLEEMGLKTEDRQKFIENWFGRAEQGQSKVVFMESQLQDSLDLTLTRNKINRFDGSTIDGALYTEKAVFQGKTDLEILLERPEDEKDMDSLKVITGMVLLVIRDLQNGYLAVGGQTAVGRGIFSGNFSGIEQTQKGKSENIHAEMWKKYCLAVRNFIKECVKDENENLL